MFKYLVLFFYFPVVFSSFISLTTPGNYFVKPEDYHYASDLVIEIWSAGGGGATAYYNSHNFNNLKITGGGGGAYLKISVKSNLETFQIIVGKGGSGSVTYFDYNEKRYLSKYSLDGDNSEILSNSLYINLSGGSSGHDGGSGGSLTEITGLNNTNYYYIRGQNSTDITSEYNLFYDTFLIKGGNNPNGGYAGAECKKNTEKITKKYSILFLTFEIDLNMYYTICENGASPGGGGCGYYYISEFISSRNIFSGGNGGDGMTVIHYYNQTNIASDFKKLEKLIIKLYDIIFYIVLLYLLIVSCACCIR